jgi:hypothetical protein
MKLFISLLVAAGTSALVACATQTPTTFSATAHDGAAPAAAAAAAAAPKKDSGQVPEGYRRVMIGGEERFCTTDPETGSRIKKDVVCLTRDELNAQQDNTRDFMKNQTRQDGTYTGTGGALPY